MKLYDIPREIESFEHAIIEAGGELTPELEQQWTNFIASGRDKIEAAAMVVRTLEAQAEACEKESRRLALKADAHNRNAKRLKDLMVYAVDALGGKVKTPLFTIWTQTSAAMLKVEVLPGANLTDLEKSHPELVRTKREANIENIKKLAESGSVVPEGFAITKTPGTHYLRIK